MKREEINAIIFCQHRTYVKFGKEQINVLLLLKKVISRRMRHNLDKVSQVLEPRQSNEPKKKSLRVMDHLPVIT